jgi:hypothetical protein
MSDPRWDDPREYFERDRDDERPGVYDERDRDEHDPRDSLMQDLDLPRGEERELVVDRDRLYELNGEDGRTLAAVGAFRIVPEHDLDIDHETLNHLRNEGLVDVVVAVCAHIRARRTRRARARVRVQIRRDEAADESHKKWARARPNVSRKERRLLRIQLPLPTIAHFRLAPCSASSMLLLRFDPAGGRAFGH